MVGHQGGEHLAGLVAVREHRCSLPRGPAMKPASQARPERKRRWRAPQSNVP